MDLNLRRLPLLPQVMYISELICIMIYYNIFSPAESIDIDEDLVVIFHKGADDEDKIQ